MTCSDCGEDKNERLFATFKTRVGETRRRDVCWKCKNKDSANRAQAKFDQQKIWRREYNAQNAQLKRERDQRRKLEIKKYVDNVKDVPCADCGRRWPPVAMDLDHVHGVKIRSIASLVSGAYNLEIIKAEVAKCEVVCACCHRLRTHLRKENVARAPSLASTPPTEELANDKRSATELDRRVDAAPSTIIHRREQRNADRRMENLMLAVLAKELDGLKARTLAERVGARKDVVYRLLCRLRADGRVRLDGETHQARYLAVGAE